VLGRGIAHLAGDCTLLSIFSENISSLVRLAVSFVVFVSCLRLLDPAQVVTSPGGRCGQLRAWSLRWSTAISSESCCELLIVHRMVKSVLRLPTAMESRLQRLSLEVVAGRAHLRCRFAAAYSLSEGNGWMRVCVEYLHLRLMKTPTLGGRCLAHHGF
jgi:hypothetical protein